MQASDVLKLEFPERYHSTQIVCMNETVGFSGARIYRVECDAGTYCLRKWPPGTEPLSRIRDIHQLLKHVFAAGVQKIPVPVCGNAGGTLVTSHGAAWQLEPWMPGKADFAQRSNSARVSSAMQVIASWHLAATKYVPRTADSMLSPVSESPSPTIARRIDLIEAGRRELPLIERMILRESDERFREAAREMTLLFRTLHQQVHSELQNVRSVRVALQPCIRDLWHDHLLFTADELTGLVDFGAVRVDTVSCDLSRLLGSLFGSDISARDDALSAYTRFRPLSVPETQLIVPLDRSGVLLSGMTWLKRRYVQQDPIRDLPRVTTRLESIVQRLNTFIGSRVDW